MADCKYLDKCPIYKHFKTKVASTIYRMQYCEGDFSKCQRYIMREKGQTPSECLLPDGKQLTTYHTQG